MADLSITASSVVAESGSTVKGAVAAVAITAGQAIYLDASGQANLADANVNTANGVKGVAINNAAAGQPVNFVAKGPVNLGNVLTAGTIYVLSSVAGAICPASDLGSTEYVTIIGVATDANTLEVDVKISGVVIA